MKLHNLIITLLFRTLLAVVLFPMHYALASENIIINNAWLREAPPSIKVMAGYLDIENRSDETLTLIFAESTEFGHIEFHLSEIQDGIAKMQQQNEIMIAANTTFIFSPKNYHLMLFNNIVPMREGRIVPIKLTFSNGKTHTFNAPIKRSIAKRSIAK